jgi:hypothetical protein
MKTDQGAPFNAFAQTDKLKGVETRISMNGKGPGLDNVVTSRICGSSSGCHSPCNMNAHIGTLGKPGAGKNRLLALDQRL